MASFSQAAISIEFRARRRWWFDVYLRTLMFLCHALGTEPNPTKVAHWILRAIYVEYRVAGARRWLRIEAREMYEVRDV